MDHTAGPDISAEVSDPFLSSSTSFLPINVGESFANVVNIDTMVKPRSREVVIVIRAFMSLGRQPYSV